MCVCNMEEIPPHGFRRSALENKMRTDDRTDIRGDAITSRPIFVGQGIKMTYFDKTDKYIYIYVKMLRINKGKLTVT